MAVHRRPLLLLLPLLPAALIVSGQDPHGQLGGMYLYSNDIPWDVPAGAPIKGVLQKVKWPEIEPAPGRWNFTGFDAECAAGGQHGAIHLVFNTYAVPEWLYSAGVKKVEVLTDKGIEPFPHYTDAAYLQRVALVQQKLCEHMESMPKEIRPFEIFFDAGPTGDTMPWGGVPTNPALNITEAQFQQVLLTITRSFLDACGPATPVMLNAGNPPYAPSDLAFFAKLKQSCPEVWYKGDRVGHGAFFNFEMQSYRLLHPLLGNGTVRSRAEGPESDAGWWTAAPAWGLRHLLSWALQFGLDYFNVHTEFAADSSNWAQLSWYLKRDTLDPVSPCRSRDLFVGAGSTSGPASASSRKARLAHSSSSTTGWTRRTHNAFPSRPSVLLSRRTSSATSGSPSSSRRRARGRTLPPVPRWRTRAGKSTRRR